MPTRIDLSPARTALDDALSAFAREATPAHRDAVLVALSSMKNAVMAVECALPPDVLIVGPSGSGKTTLALALYRMGFTGRVVQQYPDGTGVLVDGEVVDVLPLLVPGSPVVLLFPGTGVTVERSGFPIERVVWKEGWEERVAARVLGREAS